MGWVAQARIAKACSPMIASATEKQPICGKEKQLEGLSHFASSSRGFRVDHLRFFLLG
jgi:hypothetical protein